MTIHRVRLITLILILTTLSHNQSCSSNYQYPDVNTNACLPCPTNCLSCFDSFACTACVDEYYLDGNVCQSCQFGCAVCTDATTCTTCIDGLYVNADGECVPCANGVQTCTIAVVQTCKSGYFMLGDICAGCFEHCSTCQDFVTCSLCQTGYYVGPATTSCLACSSNCTVCINANTCTSCDQGYVLDGGACVAPNCSSFSPFCTKCSNGVCQECTFGKYIDANGLCSQGASLLCSSAAGPYHTNCQTNLYGCPQYAKVQTDLFTNTQLPICLPLHASQNYQYIYQENLGSTCTILSASACGSPISKIVTFTTLKSYYTLKYYLSIRVYSTAVQDFLVSYLDNSNNTLAFSLHNIDITSELTLSQTDAQCYNCKYGYTIIEGQLDISGGSDTTTLQFKSLTSFFEIRQVLVRTGMCKVSRCSSCTTAIDCVQCNQPYFLQLISCIEECDPGFYKYGRTCVLVCPTNSYPIQSSYQCQSCASPCLTCTSETQCLTCVDGYFLDGSSCVTSCSQSTLFTNLTSKACEPCPNPCTQCVITLTNATKMSWEVSCSGCGIGYLLQQGNCTYICPTGTFSNYINNKTQCSSCLTGCAECSIAQNICFSCTTNYLLDGSTCLMNYICPSGYFSNPTKNSCDKCHFPCLTCSVIGTNCTSCLKGALFNGTCPMECPTGMYIQYLQNLQICTACISPCVSCVSPTVCLTCSTGTFLYQDQCLSSCPNPTYYPQPSNNTCMPCAPPCLQCLSLSQCLSCTTGYVDLTTHKCTLQCSANSYPDGNFVCQVCPSPCIRCYSATTCSMCALPWVMYNQTCITAQQCDDLNRYIHYKLNYTDPLLSKQSGTCSKCTYPCTSCLNSPIVCKSCATGYMFVRELAICVQQCPQSYYSSLNITTNTLQCYKCNSNCLNCNQVSTNCTQCGTSMYLFSNNTCLLVCPAQFYGSNQEQICKPCQLPCSDCYNAYLCKSCASGIFYNKACVSSCPVGSLHNQTTNVCDSCTNNCLSCSILTSNCTECSTNGFYYYSHQCLTVCPTYFYANDLSHNCEACIEPCLQCTSSTQCISCRTGYYFTPYNNRCNTVCPQGYYTDVATLTCLQCNTTICRTCSMTANNCTQCAKGYYYSIDSESCVQVCPSGTYADDFYLQCRQCQFPCIVCTTTKCLTCINTYKLYSGYCYSQCPLGYYSTANNTCQLCSSTCQICSSATVCIKCVAGYYVNSASVCVPECQIGYYKGYDLLTSYPVCKECPTECAACLQTYNCTQCITNYYMFNSICVQQCPAMYYPSNSVCQPCPNFCNKCTSSTQCMECVNTYKYKNLCYPSCPPTTYTYNEESCIDCTHPCNQCTSQFSCINCIKGYFYFQNYCVQKCPDDVWKYPETNSCAGTCPYNKYTRQMQCYRVGCGGILVHLNGECLDQCPAGYYVDENQNCILCVGQAICNKIMTGQLQILRSYNLRACIYFSQLINPSLINPSSILTKIYNKNTGETLSYTPISITIDDNMIMVEFGYRGLILHSLQIKIPFVVSRESLQSVNSNLYKSEIYVYNDYQYEESGGKARLLGEIDSQFNVLYKPSTAINALAIVIVSATFLCLVANIVAKGTHYRQLVDFLQFIAATIYLQIQFPPVLQQFLKNLRIILFSFLPQLTASKPYSFSPSKFIEYHKDSSILRTQGVLLIIFLSILLIFGILILVNKYKPELLKPAIRRIKYRNICDLFSVVSLPLLVFCFRFTSSTVGDIVCSAIVLLLILGFVIYISYILMTVKNLQEIAGLAGELQETQNPLGHMYTPFSFIRKIIFGLVLCIQPTKPISTLTLLLIFTILIMVCLFFYQPFDNQITDYICIFMEIILILYVIVVMLFGLNIVSGSGGHYMGIVAVVVAIIGASVGLGWLVFLSFGAIQKWRKQSETTNDNNGLEQNLNSQPNPNKSSAVDPNSANKISGKDIPESECQQNKDQQPSAANLIKGDKNGQMQRRSRFSKNTEQYQLDLGDSEVGEQFKHWNNEESEKNQSEDKSEKAPRYLLKMQKNKQQQQ